MSARGFLGSGDLYIARYNSATASFDAYKGPYEATKFEIKPNVELKEMASKSRDGYGQVIESVALAQPANFTVEMPEVNKESLAIALLGTPVAIAEAGGSVAAEAVILKKGAWVQLTKRNLDVESIVVTKTAGATVLPNAANFDFNARLGWIRLKDASAEADGVACTVAYDHASVAGTKLRGATETQIRAKFLLDGKNHADGLPCIVRVAEGIVAADAAFDFLSDDFANVSLPGRMKTPAGETEPFTVELLDAAI